MYSDYVSTHARVIEGLRTARVRAITEMRLPEAEYAEACAHHAVPATTLWVRAEDGEVVPLCTEHTRSGLEEYDRNADTYPPAIVPLKRVGR